MKTTTITIILLCVCCSAYATDSVYVPLIDLASKTSTATTTVTLPASVTVNSETVTVPDHLWRYHALVLQVATTVGRVTATVQANYNGTYQTVGTVTNATSGLTYMSDTGMRYYSAARIISTASGSYNVGLGMFMRDPIIEPQYGF